MVLGLILCSTLNTKAQSPQHDYNVAIFLYDGVELLDFAGPGEVFGAAGGFNTYTVSVDGKPLVSQGFVTVQPQFSIANAPVPDILIFPGGNSGPSASDPRVQNWIKSRFANGAITMSVCTGAFILASTGILDTLRVTTFHNAINSLQQALPNARVLANTRFVDNGNIITTAGVSAGIDGALDLLARIKGNDVATGVARYMEYENWKEGKGLVTYTNPFLETVRKAPVAAGKQVDEMLAAGTRPAVYEGELKNLTRAFYDEGNMVNAATTLEICVKLYPGSASNCETLGELYQKLNRPSPLTQSAFVDLVRNGQIDEAISSYHDTRRSNPGWTMFDESTMNSLGYQYLQKDDYATAIRIFQLNAEAFPGSSNVYDSLGEALMKSGKKKEAIDNYKKSLALDPGNNNARQMLAQLGA